MKVLIWNEGRHEKSSPAVQAVYPEGIHGQIASFLAKREGLEIRTATLDDPEQGLSDAVLDETDVLIWWGHLCHDEVEDRHIDRIQQRVLSGMGLIVLHSGHFSKVMRRMLGTNCGLGWREGAKERVWTILPQHPIARGLPVCFNIEQEEMYCEPFDIPQPDELVFVGWFNSGEVFRSGCCYRRGQGKIFYFQPGHETYPTYYNEYVQKIICNAVEWAYEPRKIEPSTCICTPPAAAFEGE